MPFQSWRKDNRHPFSRKETLPEGQRHTPRERKRHMYAERVREEPSHTHAMRGERDIYSPDWQSQTTEIGKELTHVCTCLGGGGERCTDAHRGRHTHLYIPGGKEAGGGMEAPTQRETWAKQKLHGDSERRQQGRLHAWGVERHRVPVQATRQRLRAGNWSLCFPVPGVCFPR